MSTESLIIFVKPPVAGKVKSRLAGSIGDQKALDIYRRLLEHTISITESLKVSKTIYIADDVSISDSFPESFEIKAQARGSLGERMNVAFQDQFNSGAAASCIIGSDNFEITSTLIIEAFNRLKTNDLVIGPAFDGGYYLLGMKKLYSELFQDIEWGTDSVFKQTLSVIRELNLSYYVLKTLHDVDTLEDVKRYPELKKLI